MKAIFIQDLEKKEAEYKKSENTARSEFNSLCKQLGIPGHHVKQELAEKLKELPEIYERIAEKAKSVQKAVEFYSGFVNYTLGRQHDGGCVSMLKYVIGMLKFNWKECYNFISYCITYYTSIRQRKYYHI